MTREQDPADGMRPPIRRLVAGPDASGKTRILSDGDTPRRVIHQGSGMDMFDLWVTDMSPPGFSRDDHDPTLDPHVYFPPAGGTRFMINRIPGRKERERRAHIDQEKAAAEFYAQVPNMTDTFETGQPGMHTSHTIDYGVILEGEIDVEFDDGVTAHLKAGDTYVLKQARHGWHGVSEDGCTIMVVLVGV